MEKCIGCELCAGVCPAPLHLRARRRQPDRRPGLAGRALRLRLRDQLPAVHPLRPVRRGVPDRGDHRDQAVRVLVHEPQRRDLHEGTAARRRRRPRAGACRGSSGSAARTTTRARGCARRRRRDRRRTRAASTGRASSVSACGRPKHGQHAGREPTDETGQDRSGSRRLLRLRGRGARRRARRHPRPQPGALARCSCWSRWSASRCSTSSSTRSSSPRSRSSCTRARSSCCSCS